MKKNYSAIIIPIITLFIYTLTTTIGFKHIIQGLFYLYIFFTAGGLLYYFWTKHNKIKTSTIPIILYIIASTVLLWIGLTNWFFSPFFYFAYILAIVLAFIFSVRTTITFITTLCFLYLYFSSNDIFIDLLMLVSFILVIPITYYLQRSFLYLKQQEKEILILRESNYKNKNVVKDFLANKVDRFTIDMRQPTSDIRHLAKQTIKISEKKKIIENLNKITELGNEIIKQVDKFEKKTTGNKVIH